MVAKCKTVSKLAGTAKLAVSKDHVDEDVNAQIVQVEELVEVNEKDLAVTRTKELKSMSAADLKALSLSSGLTTGSKDDMIKQMLKHEAKARKTALEAKAKIRGVVVQKKQELEGLSTSELSKRCDSLGLKGLRSKEERVQRLLVQWQENDGVDKALSKIAEDERKQELESLDNAKLQKLCSKSGIDPFVKEIIVDRISKQENEARLYSRPALVLEEEAPKADKVDMVDALLAGEAQRKKDQELRSKQEDRLANKRKEFKSLAIEDLKKRLTKKGLEVTGKKDDMVEALFIAAVQEDALETRKSELKAKTQQELKELLARNHLEAGTKEQMITSLLHHEAKCREDLKAFEKKVCEVVEQKKEQLDTKTNAALKDICAKKHLPVGGGKEDKIDRIVEEAQKECEFDVEVSRIIRNKRKDELMSTDKAVLVKMCEQTGVEAVVKDIMVERIISHEGEGGSVAIAVMDEPVAKKARVSKK